MKKKTVAVIVCIAVLVAVVGVILTQFVWNLQVSAIRVRCTSWDGLYESVAYTADRYEKNELGSFESAYSFTGILPSENSQDYMTVSLFFEANNTSLIEKYELDGTLASAGAHKENILFVTNANAVVTPIVFRNASEWGCVALDIYKGDLSEEEIMELVKDLTVTVTAKGFLFGSHTKTVSFSQCDNIEFDVE